MFQLFDEYGFRLEDKEYLLRQPVDPRYPEDKNVTALKEMIIFITPPQGNIELILTKRWKIKLVGIRTSDGYESNTKFDFNYVPDDFYDPCIFCNLKPDGYSLPATLPTPISPARPGIRKRKMIESDPTAESQSETSENFRLPPSPSPSISSLSSLSSHSSHSSHSSTSSSASTSSTLQMPALKEIYTSPQTCFESKTSVIKVNMPDVSTSSVMKDAEKDVNTSDKSFKTLRSLLNSSNFQQLKMKQQQLPLTSPSSATDPSMGSNGLKSTLTYTSPQGNIVGNSDTITIKPPKECQVGVKSTHSQYMGVTLTNRSPTQLQTTLNPIDSLKRSHHFLQRGPNLIQRSVSLTQPQSQHNDTKHLIEAPLTPPPSLNEMPKLIQLSQKDSRNTLNLDEEKFFPEVKLEED